MKLDAAIVGNYTMDRLVYPNEEHFALGGPPAYISALFESLGVNYEVVSKVGKDFKYFDLLAKKPIVSDKPSTCFVINYPEAGERSLRVANMCESIQPKDINFAAKIAIVSGVMGEVLPETVRKISKNSATVFADIQGFIRKADSNGKIEYKKFEETEFYAVLDCIDFLKMGEDEAEFANIRKLQKQTNLVITRGEKGSSVLLKNGREIHVPAKKVEVVDSTGCGDVFLGGFAYGFLGGKTIEKCAEIATEYAGKALQTIGVPEF